jgi:hypothetical protein
MWVLQGDNVENFGNVMWVLLGNNVTKCSLTIMDANIAWLAKETNEKIGRLMWVLWGENIVECNMKYSYVGIIACLNKFLYFLLMFHILCLTNITKFEFVKMQYLDE